MRYILVLYPDEAEKLQGDWNHHLLPFREFSELLSVYTYSSNTGGSLVKVLVANSRSIKWVDLAQDDSKITECIGRNYNQVSHLKALRKAVQKLYFDQSSNRPTSGALCRALTCCLCMIRRISTEFSLNQGFGQTSTDYLDVHDITCLIPHMSDLTLHKPLLLNLAYCLKRTNIKVHITKLCLEAKEGDMIGNSISLTNVLDELAFITNGSVRSIRYIQLLQNFSRSNKIKEHGQCDMRFRCHCHSRIMSDGFLCSLCYKVYCSTENLHTECSQGGGGDLRAV